MKKLPQSIKIFAVCFALMATYSTAVAQISLSGKFVDKAQDDPLIGVNILLTSLRDTSIQLGGTSDVNGAFELADLQPGVYRLRATYIGYEPYEQVVSLMRESQDLGTIGMAQAATLLEGVTVQDVQIRAQQKGDTTEYNANAFKVNPDADAEQLVRKMPGVTVENGTVKAQGEDVQRVLVDGQEFFGNDATLALRNLPAEVIEKVQVFDRMSDQSQFTGFDDGNAEKTINIITRPGMNNGQFGKIYAGYGTDERYQAGGNLNIFNGQQRITIIGLSNNINQQNFSTQDLLGALGTTNSRRGGGGRGRWRGRGGSGPNPNDFLIGQQGGINTTNSIGLNYTDNWGEKIKINGSYFFNNANNETQSLLEQEFFLTENESQFYDEDSFSESENYNHRLNARFEYTIDDANSLIIRPSLNMQDNSALSLTDGTTTLEGDNLLNTTLNDFSSDNQAFPMTFYGGIASGNADARFRPVSERRSTIARARAICSL